MSESYIKSHFCDIKKYADAIEKRLDDAYCTTESVLADNEYFLEQAKAHGQNYLLIDGEYNVDIEL